MGKSLPFSNRPDTRSYFPYPIHEEAYRKLGEGIAARAGLIILTSAEGTGKTLLLRRFIRTVRSNAGLRIHLFESPWRDPASALQAIARIYERDVKHVSLAKKKERVRERLAKLYANGVTPVLLVDNATFIDFEVLDVLVELVNANDTGLQVVLSGASELGSRLQLNKSEVWESATRIGLKHFDQAGTSQYIDHQLHLAGLEAQQLFSQNTVDRIQSYSGGIPVKINNLCNIALSLNNVGQNKKPEGGRAPADPPRGSGRLYVDTSWRHTQVGKRPFAARVGPLVPYVAITLGALAVVYVTNRGDLPSGFSLPAPPGGEVAERSSVPVQSFDEPLPRTDSVLAQETAAGESVPVMTREAERDASGAPEVAAPTPTVEETGTEAAAQAPEGGLSVVLNDAWERLTGWFESPPAESDAVGESAAVNPETVAQVPVAEGTEPMAREAERDASAAVDASVPGAPEVAAPTPTVEETGTEAAAQAPEGRLSVVLNDAWERLTGWFESPPAESDVAGESAAVNPETVAQVPVAEGTEPMAREAERDASAAPDVASRTPEAGSGAPTLAGTAAPVTGVTQTSTEASPDPATAVSAEPGPSDARTTADAMSEQTVVPDSAPQPRDLPAAPALLDRVRVVAGERLDEGAPDSVAATGERPAAAGVQRALSDTEIVAPPSAAERAHGTGEAVAAESASDVPAVADATVPDQAQNENAVAPTDVESDLYGGLREPTTSAPTPESKDENAGRAQFGDVAKTRDRPTGARVAVVGSQAGPESVGANAVEQRNKPTEAGRSAADAGAVATLLERASRQLAREQLTLPAGANALDTYREVLRLDPDNRTARRGIEGIKALYGEWARYAARRGEWNTVVRYYQRALRIDSKDPQLLSELKLARNRDPSLYASAPDSGRARALAELERAGKSVTPTALADSAMNGDIETARLLLQAGMKADSDVDAYGYTALMFAAMNGYPELVGLLLDNDADVNRQSEDGRTALMVAAWNGHDSVVRYLISRGADVNIRNEESWTALTHAAWKGHKRIAQTLLDHGADPKVRNRDGWTALDSARRRGHGTVVQLIRRYTP